MKAKDIRDIEALRDFAQRIELCAAARERQRLLAELVPFLRTHGDHPLVGQVLSALRIGYVARTQN